MKINGFCASWVRRLNNCRLRCWMRLFPRYRSHGLHAASGCRPAVVARFPRRISLPRLPLDAVHPSQQRAALHARAWCLSRIARHVIDFHSTRPYLNSNPLQLHSFQLISSGNWFKADLLTFWHFESLPLSGLFSVEFKWIKHESIADGILNAFAV